MKPLAFFTSLYLLGVVAVCVLAFALHGNPRAGYWDFVTLGISYTIVLAVVGGVFGAIHRIREAEGDLELQGELDGPLPDAIMLRPRPAAGAA